MEIARLHAVIGADTTPLQDALSRARGMLSGFGSAMGRATESASGLNVGLLNLSAGAQVLSGLVGVARGVAGALMGVAGAGFEAVAGYERMALSIQSLTAREIILSSATGKGAKSAKTMAAAMEEARGKTDELLRWIQQLAIQSPFSRDDVAQAYKTALTYGYTSKEAQRLTNVMIDFAAATGASGAVMAQIAYPLGQIRASDKLLTQDLRQLMNVGVPVQSILAEMGLTLADVGKKSVSSAKFLEQFQRVMERDFGGSAKAQAGTLAGLVASLEDIKDISFRNLFTPLFRQIQPEMDRLVSTLQLPGVAFALDMLGKAMGRLMSGPVAWIGDKIGRAGRVMEEFKRATEAGVRPVMALRWALAQVVGHDVVGQFHGLFVAVDRFVTRVGDVGPLEAMKDAIRAIAAPEVADPLTGLLDLAGLAPQKLQEAWEKLKSGDIGGAVNVLGSYLGDVDDWLQKNVLDKLPGALRQIWTQASVEIDKLVAGAPSFFERLLGVGDGAKNQAEFDKYWGEYGPIISGDTLTPAEMEMARLMGDIGRKAQEWVDLLVRAIEAALIKKRETGFPWNIILGGPTFSEAAAMQEEKAQIEAKLMQDLGAASASATGFFAGIDKALVNFFSGLSQSLGLEPKTAGEGIGKSLIEGVAVGVRDEAASDAIRGSMTGAIDAALSQAKQAYEIRSPSGVTAREIGLPLGEGIGAGMRDAKDRVTSALVALVSSALAAAKAQLLASPDYRLPAPVVDTGGKAVQGGVLPVTVTVLAALGDRVAGALGTVIATAPSVAVNTGILALINSGATAAAASGSGIETLNGLALVGDAVAPGIGVAIRTAPVAAIRDGIVGIVGVGTMAAAATFNAQKASPVSALGDAIAVGIGQGVAAGDMGNIFISGVRDALGALRSSLQIANGNSRVAYTEIGHPMATGMALGFDDHLGELHTAMHQITSLIAVVARVAFEDAKAIGVGIVDGIIAGMKERAIAYGVSVTGMSGGAQPPAQQMPPRAASAGDVVVPVVIDGEKVAQVAVNRITGEVYADGKRYGR